MGLIRPAAQERAALNSLLNIAAAVGPETFVTKTGHPMMILRLHGQDDECLSPAERNAVARRFEQALRNFSDDDRIYQYALKSQHPDLERPNYRDAVVQKAIDTRLEHLSSRAERLYRHERFLVVVHEGASVQSALAPSVKDALHDPVQTIQTAFSKPKTVTLLEDAIARESVRLQRPVTAFQKQLEDVMRVELLGKEEGFRFLRRLVNYAPHKTEGQLAHELYIDYQLCQSSLECYRDRLELDGYTVKVLTIKEAPSQTQASMWRKLYDLSCESIIVQEWQAEPTARMLGRIQSMRRHHVATRTSFLSHLGSHPAQAHEILVDQGAEGHIYDLGECQRELELNGRRFGRVSFTIILYDRNPSKVRQAIAEAYRVVSADGATLLEERGNLLDAWLAAFPGNSRHNRRLFWLMDSNYADTSFLFAPNAGELWNRCLDREHLAAFETLTGSPYFFNLHYGEIAHTLVLGPTGAGKSFLLNFLVTFAQKYQPWTCIFDVGGSYAYVTRLFKGSYLKIGLNSRCKINPFALPRTPENRLFQFSFVKVLIESAGCTLDNRDEQELYAQIDNLYEMDPDHRRLLSLASILNRKLRHALSRWVEGGAYAQLFDNVEDELTFARFQAFEFSGMEEVPQIIEPLLFYVLHRASAVIADPAQAATFKLFIVDEAWRFLQNPTIRDYIAEGLRTWRKRNAGVVLATQSVNELQNTPIFNVLLESCPTKMFLANPVMDQALYCDLFRLSPTEAAQVASLTPRRDILLKRPDLAKVLQLNVDAKSYWLFANSPGENQRRREVFQRHGFEEGLEILSRSVAS